MRCAKVQKILHLYLDGELRETEGLKVAQHLTSCQKCASEWAFLRQVVSLIEAYPYLEPPGEFTAEVLSQLERQPLLVHRRTSWQEIVPPVAAGICIALLVFFGMSIKKSFLSWTSLWLFDFQIATSELKEMLNSLSSTVFSLPGLLSAVLPEAAFKVISYIGIPAMVVVNLLFYLSASRGNLLGIEITTEKED